MNKIIIFAALLLCNICTAFAAGDVTLTVHLTNKKLAEQSLTIVLLKDYIYGDLGAAEMHARADQNGCFTFKIKASSAYKMYYLQFDNFRFMSGWIEPGDQVRIEFSGSPENYLNRNNFQFSGRGSTKMNLWRELMYDQPRTILKLNATQADDQSGLALLVNKADSIYHYKLSILGTYRGRVSAEVFQYYHAQVYGSAYTGLFSFFITNKSITLDSAKISYLIREAEKNRPVLDPKVSSECDEFTDYLLSKSANAVHYGIRASREDAYEATFKDLIASNTGILREKALLRLIFKDTRYRYSKDPAAVYHNALKYMSNHTHRQLVQDIAFKRKRGTPAFDFSMTGMSGDTVRLHDFKNKVVLIEGWFLGCESCLELAKKIKNKVLPQFINNPDVIFLTVNVDRTKERWLKGIRGGEYTNSKSINLYTDGQGTNHPFLKYYQMQGMPQLLLVGKDGNLISTDIRGTADEISDKLKLALLQ